MKGQMLQMEFVVKAVLLLLALVFILMVVMRLFGPSMDRMTSDALCRQSVGYNHGRRVPGIDVETVKVNCPSKYITFKMDGYLQEEEKAEGLSLAEDKDTLYPYKEDYMDCSRKEGDEQEACRFYAVNEKIAQEMKSCWDKFWLGNLKVFSSHTTDRQCIVCATFMFDPEMISEYESLGYIGDVDPEDPHYSLEAFMQTQKIRAVGDTYYNYTLDILDKNWEPDYYNYRVDEEYSIVFAAINELYIRDKMQDLWNSIKSMFGVSTPENPNYINTIQFIPNNEVASRCDSWA